MAETTAARIADRLPRYTAIIGGGGKTTLMLALGEELARRGHSVLLTTTTHLAWPTPRRYGFLAPRSLYQLNRCAQRDHILIAGYGPKNNRLTGIPTDWYDALAFDYILCEADGSARLPLKVHKDTEPVIPPCTQLLIQVAGLSALGKTMGEVVHRYPLLGERSEVHVTRLWIAGILERGWDASHWTGPAISILNQADTDELTAAGRWISKHLSTASMVCSLHNENAPNWEDSE